MRRLTATHLIVVSALLGSLPLCYSSAQLAFDPNRRIPILPIIEPVILADLQWGDRTTYALDGPQTREIRVDGFGIDDFVDVLETLDPITISQDVFNRGSSAGGDYLVNLTIRRMIFRSVNVGTGVVTGWVTSQDPNYVVYSEDIVGPPLTLFEAFRAEFTGIDPQLDFPPLNNSRCGMYEATLTVDSDELIAETNEQNNQTTHYFFIPSAQVFNITVAPRKVVNRIGPRPMPGFATFTVTPAVPGPVPIIYKHFSVSGGIGIRMTTLPAPNPLALITLNGPLQIVVNGLVPPGTPTTAATGKVTVMSQDGCVIKQESVELANVPPGAPPFASSGGFLTRSFGESEFAIEPLDQPLLLDAEVLLPAQ